MTTPTADNQGTSTRPYLVRALHEWCTDNGFTPYIAVFVAPGVKVPMEYVKNNEIVLNVGFEATSSLKLGNELIEFKARFGGVSREIAVPLDHVVAIYARENGQGMAFPVPAAGSRSEGASGAEVPRAPTLRLASVDSTPAPDLAADEGSALPPAARSGNAPALRSATAGGGGGHSKPGKPGGRPRDALSDAAGQTEREAGRDAGSETVPKDPGTGRVRPVDPAAPEPPPTPPPGGRPSLKRIK